MCLYIEGKIILSFCHADQISLPQFSLIRQIRQLKLLAMHYNDDGILIQTLEQPRVLLVNPSAEQAVTWKCPSKLNVMTTQFR
jgi:hypothetical protein